MGNGGIQYGVYVSQFPLAHGESFPTHLESASIIHSSGCHVQAMGCLGHSVQWLTSQNKSNSLLLCTEPVAAPRGRLICVCVAGGGGGGGQWDLHKLHQLHQFSDRNNSRFPSALQIKHYLTIPQSPY